MIAIVTQDTILFNDTIASNITYGQPDCSKERMYAAAQAANAHKFILEQSDGYETVIGEKGARLSGGQRQRLSIARALVKDAVNHQAKIDQMTDRALVAKWPIARIDPTLRGLFRAAGAE